jgi:carboxyl-terminal processing protease
VVLDLRGNSGGYLNTLYYFLGGMFGTDVKIFDRIGRSSTDPVSVRGRAHNAFMGKLVVLIDSRTASVSEIFARVIQLQTRGTIVGDRSSGRVMETRRYAHGGSKLPYSVIVAEADIAMSDGKKLENVGVEPDIVVLPTSGDLANSRDPVMAKAVALLGVQLSPEEAAMMFPN